MLQAELLFLAKISTKSFGGCGFAPDPTGGTYSAPPDTLAVFRGLLLKEGRGGKERGERKGEGGALPLPSFLLSPSPPFLLLEVGP